MIFAMAATRPPRSVAAGPELLSWAADRTPICSSLAPTASRPTSLAMASINSSENQGKRRGKQLRAAIAQQIDCSGRPAGGAGARRACEIVAFERRQMLAHGISV